MGFTNATRGIETGFLMETDNLQHLYWRMEMVLCRGIVVQLCLIPSFLVMRKHKHNHARVLHSLCVQLLKFGGEGRKQSIL